MKNKLLEQPLIERLQQADICCRDCGSRYGKYSVGCSSVWESTCDVCGKFTGVTEVRDYGYLQKGINELKQAQAESTAEDIYQNVFLKGMNQQVSNNNDAAPYEQGEIACMFTEDEIGFLNECLDTIGENHPTLCPGHTNEDPSDVPLFEGIVEKIETLYQDHCVKYSLSPAMKAYIARYGAIPGPEDDAKWEVFRDTYNWMIGEGSGNE